MTQDDLQALLGRAKDELFQYRTKRLAELTTKLANLPPKQKLSEEEMQEIGELKDKLAVAQDNRRPAK